MIGLRKRETHIHTKWEREREKENETCISHLLVFSLNGHRGQGWARCRPGAKKSMQVFHAIPLLPRVCFGRRLEWVTRTGLEPGSLSSLGHSHLCCKAARTKACPYAYVKEKRLRLLEGEIRAQLCCGQGYPKTLGNDNEPCTSASCNVLAAPVCVSSKLDIESLKVSVNHSVCGVLKVCKSCQGGQS